MGFNRKLSRSRLGRTANKIFSTTMAATFALTPLAQIASAAEGASNIVRTDGTRIEFNNNVADIYAEKVKNEIGINRFQYFDLADGNIANLYFNEQNSNVFANKLINLVQNQISIAGAVNAIKDGKIGGDLFFLSPKGMVVSGSGVINAGSLNVAVPTQDFFDKLSYATGKDTNGTIDLFYDDADTILGNAEITKQLMGEVAYPVNPSGTIAVAGKINVANVARLAANEVRTEASSLIRNAVDFSAIANVPQNLADQATINGIDKKLTAKVEGDGIYILGQNDVVINGEIQANNGVADIRAVNEKTVNLGELKGDNAKLLDLQNLQASANITIGNTANISAAEGVNIQATAKTKFVGTTVNAPAGKSGAAAKSAGEKVKDGIAESKGSGSLTDNVKSMLEKINVMLDENETTAAVAVKEGAKIASSGDVAIKADASSESNMTLTIQPKDVGSSGSSTLSKLLVGGANYSKNHTTARVDIDAVLGDAGSEIKGNLDIAANAKNVSKIKTTIKSNAKDGQSNTGYLTAAINVVNQSANAEVNINKDISANGNVDIKAISNSTLDVAAGTAVDNNAAAATAINIVDTKTKAVINAKGNITSADGSVSLAAENKYEKISITTDNAYKKPQTGKAAGNSPAGGSSSGNAGTDPTAGEEEVVESSGTAGAADGLQDLLGKDQAAAPAADAGIRGANKNADDKQGATSGDTEAVKEAKGTTETDKKPEQSKKDDAKKTDSKTGWNQYFDIGASVMTGNFDNQSTINVGGNISAKKDVSVRAETNPANIAIRTSNTLTNTQKNAKVGVAAAVAVANMHNDASVIVQGGKLNSTEGSIDLSAHVKHNKTLADAIANALAAAGSAASDDLNAVKDVKSVNDAKDTAKLKNISNSLDATMSTESLTGSTSDNELSAVANGTVGIENVTNNANVYLGNAADGSNTELNAGKDVNLSAKVDGMDINKAGKFQTNTTSGASVGIGGTVGVQNNYNNSKVEATGNTKIKAGENITANAENDILNIVSAIGGSKTSTLGVTGMVASMGGESNAKVDMQLSASNDPALQGKIINIGTKNTTVLGNMAGQLSESQTAAIGASVGVISYDIYSSAKLKGADSAKPITINADGLNIKTENASYAANLTVAGVSSQNKSAKNATAKSDDVAGTSIKVRANKSSSGGSASDSENDTMIELQDLTADSDGKQKSDGSEASGDAAPTADSIEASKDDKGNVSEQSKEKTEEQKKNASKVNIAAAGSVAWNDVNTSAETELANAKITPASAGGAVAVGTSAEDSAYIGAFSGAMALTKAGGNASAGSQGFSATLAGAVAGNDIVKKTSSILNGVQITNGETLQNTAINKGAQIATGVALGSTTKAGYGATGAGAASLNYVDSKVHAELASSTINADDIKNVASDSDLQIAGGISIDYAKNNAGIGAAVSVNKAANDIAATLNSSTLKEVAKIHNEAASQLMQIGTAVSVGVATGDKNAALLNGAVAANTISNQLTSTLSGTKAQAETLDITAHDGSAKVGNIQGENSYVADTATSGFDISTESGKIIAGKDMRSYLGKDTSVNVKTEQNNNSLKYANSEYQLSDGGNTIVAGAIGVAAGKTNAAIAGSVVYNKVENDFKAGIDGVDVAAQDINIAAHNNTNMIGAAAGAAIAAQKTGAAAAGSVAIQDISNKIAADVQNSNIKNNTAFSLKAKDASTLISVAGQGTGATTAAAGMAWAQNNLDNAVRAHLSDTNIAQSKDVTISANNNAAAWAVGASAGLTAGGAQSVGGTLEGAFAGNVGKNNTEAYVENSNIQTKNINVVSTNQGKLSAIAGDVSVSTKNVALGGAVAINKVGTKGDVQKNSAYIKDTSLTINKDADDNSEINVKAEDDDTLLTVAAGGGVAAGNGVAGISGQGSVADSAIYRDTLAKADNLNLVDDEVNPSLNIKAARNSKITSTADALSVSAGTGNAQISAAAGVSMVNIAGDVQAGILGLETSAVNGKYRGLKKLSINADSVNNIMNIGLGASVAAGSNLGAALTGNVAINNIAVNTRAWGENIGNADGLSIGSAAIQANSKDVVKNYAGSLNVSATGNAAAGLGATVVVNSITGNTESKLSNSNIEIGEETAGEAADYAAGSGSAQGTMTSTKSTKFGLLVSADSQHEIENVAVTAGVAASATAAATVDAVVATNKIAGATSAVLAGKNNLSAKENTAGAINVLANNSAVLNSTIVGAAVGVSGTAGIAEAAAVDNSSFSRQVKAAIEGGTALSERSNISFNGDVNVRATNAQSAKVDTYGAAAGASGTAGVALTGSVSNENFASATEAGIKNVEIAKAKNVFVTADTAKKLDIGNGAYGVAGGVGAASGAVGVINVKDESSTKAEMGSVTVKNTAGASGAADKNIKVLATNNSVLNTLGTTGSAAIGLGGALATTVGVSNIKNSVETSLHGVDISADWQDFQAKSANNIKLSATNAAVSGSLAAVGVGVAVNTIDSATHTNITDSVVRANKIAVTADEERNFNVDMLGATLAGAGVVTNVNINNIGKAVEDSYDYDGAAYSTKDIKNQAQAGLDKLDGVLNNLGTAYGDKAGIEKSNKHNAEFGGTNAKAGVGVSISGSTLGKKQGSTIPNDSTGSVQVASTAVNNGKISVKQGNASFFGGVNASVGITDVKNSNRLALKDSTINASQIAVEAKNQGNITQEVYQGAASVFGAANVAVAKLMRSGSNIIDIQNTSLLAQSIRSINDTRKTSALHISALDTNSLTNRIIGASAAGVAAGVLVSNVSDQTKNGVSVGNGSILKNVDYTASKEKITSYRNENGNLIATTTEQTIEKPEYGDIDITAKNDNAIASDVQVGTVGVASGSAAVSTIDIGSERDAAQGMTSINLSGTNTLQGKNINLISDNAVQANSNAHGVGAGLIAAGGVVSKINSYGGSRTSLGSTKFMADAVNAKAFNNQKLRSEAHGVSASGAGVAVNIAEANLHANTSVEAGDISLSKNIWVDTQKFTNSIQNDVAAHEEQIAGGTLNILAEDTSSSESEAKGTVVGIVAASGTNRAITSNTSTVNVSLAANDFKADNLNVAANAKTSSTTYADGTGGGIIDISPQAAYAENTNKSTANVDIKGNYQLANAANISAVNNNKTEMLADAMSATVVGGSGVEAKNSSSQRAEVNIKEGTVLTTGGKIDIAARNAYSFGAAKDAKYVLKGNGYGGITNEVGRVDNVISGTAKVNIASGSSIVSGKDMTIAATTRNDVKSDAYVYSLGLFSGNYLNNTMKIAVNDSVNQNAGSSLKTSSKEADLTLAAADSQNISTNTTAETAAGLAGVTSAKAENNIERTSTINANGDVYSKKDVNLYAGKFAGDELSNLKLDISAEVYNKVGLPLKTAPTLTNKLSQKNTVNIGGRVRSVQDANIYADAGKESISQFAGAYTIYSGSGEHKFVSTTNGKLNVEGGTQLSDVAANKKDNHVNVSGSVTAGIANVQKVTIGDADKGLIVLTKDEYAAVAEYHKKNGTAMPDNYVVAISDADYSKLSDTERRTCKYKKLSELVSIKDNEGKDVSAEADITSASFSVGSYKYANSLKNRMNELTALMIEYPDGAAHAGYLAEYTRLADELVASGMATKNPNGSYTIKNDTGVAYIDIPELIAAGGNINLQTNNVYGSGSLTAKGSPNIDIQNNTSLSINVGNLQVANPGGVICYNGSNMKDAAAINAKNEDQSKKLAVASATGGTAGSISISNNFSGKNSFNYRNTETNQDLEAPIISDINIKGSILADNGSVNINNAQGNISISGGAASVVGKDVIMTAAKGSISQDFTDDIVNIGGDVQNQYNSVNYRDTTGSGVISGTGSGSAKGAGRIAGSNIYINATDVNINGLIQSGFDNYHVEIKLDAKLDKDLKPSTNGTMTVSSRMDQIKHDNMGRNLSDSDVLGNPEYRLIGGGQSYNESKGYYEYIIPVYYNPSTGALLTPDVESGGGQIFISGRISSTGNGQILCLDGASDISINNDLNNKLVTGKLLSNNVSGKITLADTVTNTLSVITRNNDGTSNYKISALDSKINYTGKGGLKEDGKGGLYFAPDENLRYNWTTGQQVGTTKTYEKQWQDTWWGLSDNSSSAKDYLVDQSNKLTPTSTGTASTVTKRNGAYIGAVTGDQANSINGSDYSIWQKNEMTSSSMKVDEEKHWSSGFLGCHKNHYYRWTVSEGKEQTNFYSVNAHQNIKIGFIGKADGNSKVDVTSKGSIDLTGSVGNRNYAAGGNDKLLGTVNITSTNGSINQLGGSIYGGDIAVKAAGDMHNIDIAAAKDVNLTVGSLAGSGLSRDVSITVNGYQGSEGNVHLTMADDANAVGKDSFALTTKGSKGDIETVGNSVINARRIDLASGNGDITASVKGGQQALGSDTLSASVNAKANGNINLTQTEGDMRIGRIYSDNGDVTLSIANGSVVDALPYGTMQRDDENTLMAKWTNMGLFGNGDNAMLKEKQAINDKVNAAATKDEERVGDYSQWNKDALLYTIQDSIINPTSDTLPTTASKDPNIKANNITLNVANNAGIETGNITNIAMSDLDLSTADGMANLKKLSQADASNVSWDKNNQSFVISERLPIGVQTNTAAGKLTVGKYTGSTLGKADGNVFIEGRTQVDSDILDKGNKDLNISAIMANGNVSISSLGSILNGAEAGKAAITGQNLYLSAANAGSIGTRDRNLTIDLLKDASGANGTLQAIGSAGIFVDNVGDNALSIKSVSSGGDLVLNAKGDIVMADKTGSTGAADSVLQTENGGTIELVSREGSVGTAEEKNVDGKTETIYDSVRVRNAAESGNEPKVMVKAAKSIAIEGMGSAPTGAEPSGVLNVQISKTDENGDDLENIYLNAHGKLRLANDLTASKNIKLASDAALLVDKNLTANTISLAAKGDILQDAATAIKAAADTHATGNAKIELLGTNNHLSSLTVDSLSKDMAKTGTIRIVNGSGDIDVTMLNSSRDGAAAHVNDNLIAGNIYIKNNGTGTLTLAKDHDLHSEGSIMVSSQGGIIADHELWSHGDMALDSKAGIHIKNDLTAWDVTAGGECHNITLNAAKEITTEAASTILGNDIKFNADTGDINNSALVLADGEFRMVAGEGDIINRAASININNADLPTMSNDIYIEAKKGSVISDEDIIAENDITIKSHRLTGSISNNIYAGRNIFLQVSDGNLLNTARLESKAGDITLQADNGNILNGQNGNIFAFGGNATLSAGGIGSVYNQGDILALDNNAANPDAAGNIVLKSENGNVVNTSDFNTIDGSKTTVDSESAKYLGGLKSYDVAAKNITMSAVNGKLENTKDHLVARGNVTLTAKEGLNSLGKDIYAGGDIKLTATDGTMVNNAKLVSVNGNVELTAENGSVINMLDGDIFAMGGDVKLVAGARQEADHGLYKVSDKGNIEKITGFDKPADMPDDAVIITKKFYYIEAKDQDGNPLQDEHGNTYQLKKYIDADDRVSDHKGDLYTEVRYIAQNGEEKSLNIFDDPSDNTQKTNILKNDNAEFFRQGDVINRGDAVAMGSTRTVADEATGESHIESVKAGTVMLESRHGNASNYDNFEAVDGKKELEIDGRSVFNKNTGELYANKKYMLANGNISLRAPEGRFYNDFAIKTSGDLTMESNYDIVIGNGLNLAEVNGNLNLISSKGSVTNGENSKIIVNGNINVSGATGVVNKGEFIAKGGGDVNMSSSGGDIIVGDIIGGRVVISSDKADGVIDVSKGTITSDSYLGIHGDNVKGTIQAAKGDNYQGTMGFGITGAKGGAMKGDMSLVNDGDTTFDILHITDGQAKIGGNGTLKAENVKTKGNLDLYVKGSKTTILGRKAGKQDGQYIYANNGGWMNFFIDNRTHQTSNALLLHIADFHYADSQRFALDDLAGQLLDFNPLMSHRQLLADNIGLFNRYNLYDSTHAKNELAGFGTDNVLDINSTDGGLELVGTEA